MDVTGRVAGPAGWDGAMESLADGRGTPLTVTIDVHIHRLRRKLGPGYAQYLVTVRRAGYVFRPPVTP